MQVHIVVHAESTWGWLRYSTTTTLERHEDIAPYVAFIERKALRRAKGDDRRVVDCRVLVDGVAEELERARGVAAQPGLFG